MRIVDDVLDDVLFEELNLNPITVKNSDSYKQKSFKNDSYIPVRYIRGKKKTQYKENKLRKYVR
jgi:hypothetical protein